MTERATSTRRDAGFLVGRPRRFSAGPKPGAVSSSGELGRRLSLGLLLRRENKPIHPSQVEDKAVYRREKQATTITQDTCAICNTYG
jgi:hypothetical protein